MSVTLSELLSIPFKADLKFVTAPRDYRDRPLVFSVAAKMSALATIPVPHASVSSSTPRSYVRMAIFVGSAFLDEVYVCAVR